MLAASIHSALGRAGLMLMLASSVFGIFAILYGIRSGRKSLLRQAPRYAWLAFAGIAISVVMMPSATLVLMPATRQGGIPRYSAPTSTIH